VLITKLLLDCQPSRGSKTSYVLHVGANRQEIFKADRPPPEFAAYQVRLAEPCRGAQGPGLRVKGLARNIYVISKGRPRSYSLISSALQISPLPASYPVPSTVSLLRLWAEVIVDPRYYYYYVYHNRLFTTYYGCRHKYSDTRASIIVSKQALY
jgi:hypothetical protein